MSDRRRLVTASIAVIGLVAALTLGYLLKAQCLSHVWDGFQYRSSCYNDIYALASFRGINDGKVPYFDGNGIEDGPDGDLEYPIGTGYVVILASFVASDGREFFITSALLLGLFGLLAGLLLIALARDRWRLALVFAAPPLVLYAFHNWDLLPMLCVVVAILAWRSGRSTATGVWLGIGAAAKVYPGLMIPAFLIAEGRRIGRIPRRMLLAAMGAFAAMNLPIMLVNLPAWFFPWRFQSTRFPNFETHWYFLYRHVGDGSASSMESYARLTSVLSGLAFVIGLLVLIRRENRRAEVRPIALSFAILVLWLLTAKVYSPQFSLWLLPFFALVAIPKRIWVAFVLTDGAVWAAISFFFLAEQGTISSELRLWIVEAATLARYAFLVWLLRAVEHAEERVRSFEPSVPGPPGDREQAEAFRGG